MLVVTENVPFADAASGRGEGVRGQELERFESPAATINTVHLRGTYCVLSGTVLEVNRIDPAFSPREHSLHLQFALRLIGFMGKGRSPPRPHCHLPHPFQNTKSRAGSKDDGNDVCNTVEEPGNDSLLRSCRALPLPQVVRTGGRELSRGPV